MADISVPWGTDFVLSSSGGLAIVDGAALTQERVVRRLLTNPGDYIWDLTYGAGLGAYVGQPVDVAALTAVITEQCMLEATVASVISVVLTQDGLGDVTASIALVDTSGTPQTILVST